MAVNFPDNPVVNDEFTSGTRTWIWEGTVWLLKQSINFQITNLNDVAVTTLADGDALLYNSTTQKWENGAVDVQGAINTANSYTDQAVVDITAYIDAFLNSVDGTTVDYIDQQDAITLAAANTYTDTAIADIIGTAPGTLDTFQELAAAINNDPDFLANLDVLPLQTGNGGNYLTTDGTTASWAPLDITATTVSEDPPLLPEVGDAWFRSSTGQFFIYYDGFWIEIGAGSEPDLSAYYTSAETDTAIATAIAVKKTEINQALSADATMQAGYRYFVDTSATRTLTLPATPAVGDEIQLFDAVGTGSTNNVTINNNSNKINGVLDSAIIDIDGFATVFVYTGSTYGWRMI